MPRRAAPPVPAGEVAAQIDALSRDPTRMAIGTTVKTIQDIMRKDAGVDGDAQRISQLV